MSKERFCPECGAKLAEDARFCPDCGTDFEEPETLPAPEEAAPIKERTAPVKEHNAPVKGQDSSLIGPGARINTNGGISSTSNSVSNSTTTSTTSVNTQSVDNSSTVNHNTTIVMGGKDKSEYCEVCGNPFGDKHARCPKCGKQICFDCKVKNKNRCIECEKKAVNEYRVAFHQLLLTPNGYIGIAGRQMMDSKARVLDVEDVKAGIEKELTDLYKPAAKPVQPVISQPAPQNTHVNRPPQTPNNPPAGQKSVGTFTGGAPVPPRSGYANTGKSAEGPQDGGKKNKWLIPVIAGVAIIIAVVVFLTSKGNKQDGGTAPATETEQTQPAVTPQQPVATPQQPATTPQQPENVASDKPHSAKKPAPEPKKDAEYEAGMAAYEKGEGLEAIGHFKASGSADAYYMLGVIYEQGCGSVGKNAMMARQNFKKAADLGSAKAKAKL